MGFSNQVSETLDGVAHSFLLGRLYGSLKKRQCISKLQNLDLEHQFFQWSTKHLGELELCHLVVAEFGEDMKAVAGLHSAKREINITPALPPPPSELVSGHHGHKHKVAHQWGQ